MKKDTKPNKVTEEDKKVIEKLYLDGMGIKEISDKTGFTTSTVNYWLRRVDVYIARKRTNKPRAGSFHSDTSGEISQKKRKKRKCVQCQKEYLDFYPGYCSPACKAKGNGALI